jgi:hypothetical protein
MLLIVIVGLTVALAVREREAVRREAEFQARVAELQTRLAKCRQLAEHMQWQRDLPITEQLARQIIVEAQGSMQ